MEIVLQAPNARQFDQLLSGMSEQVVVIAVYS